MHRLTWWAFGCFTVFFGLPALLVRLGFRERLADYGLKLRGAFADWWVYAVMFAVVGPLVLLASRDPHFQQTYPFYHPQPGRLGPDFWRWEALYALQFLGVEFFFRGFLVHGLKHRFGAYAIAVMTVPYCMLHFFKPLPEALHALARAFAAETGVGQDDRRPARRQSHARTDARWRVGHPDVGWVLLGQAGLSGFLVDAVREG